VVNSADSDFAKSSRRLAADIRTQNLPMPALIERQRPSGGLAFEGFFDSTAALLSLEWKMVYNDPTTVSRCFLFPLVVGTAAGCTFFGLPTDALGAQGRAGYFWLLLVLFCADAVAECRALRRRLFWPDCCRHRVGLASLAAACLFGELVLRRAAPVAVLVTGSYVFMGLAESLPLYLGFLALSVLAAWLIFLLPLSFDLAVTALAHPPGPLWGPVPPPGPRAHGPGAGAAAARAASLCGLAVLGLAVLTMGFPLSPRDVPPPLAWLGWCLPLRACLAALVANQVNRPLFFTNNAPHI
jgi:hypothetical protein